MWPFGKLEETQSPLLYLLKQLVGLELVSLMIRSWYVHTCNACVVFMHFCVCVCMCVFVHACVIINFISLAA